MQAVVKAPGEPVASLDDREGAADCFREAAILVVICCIYVNLQSCKCWQPQQKMEATQDKISLRCVPVQRPQQLHPQSIARLLHIMYLRLMMRSTLQTARASTDQ